MTDMTAIHTPHRNPLDRPALVQVGPWQFTVDLPGGVRVGDEDWTHKLGKTIAAGIESAFEQFPPRASV